MILLSKKYPSSYYISSLEGRRTHVYKIFMEIQSIAVKKFHPKPPIHDPVVTSKSGGYIIWEPCMSSPNFMKDVIDIRVQPPGTTHTFAKFHVSLVVEISEPGPKRWTN